MLIRRRVYYSGDVQGVGFRYTARSLGRQREVGGFVRNLSDGRVELVAEGEEAEVLAFLGEVEEAMRGYIRGTQVVEEAPTGVSTGFGVAF
jgi:acylphosphatase